MAETGWKRAAALANPAATIRPKTARPLKIRSGSIPAKLSRNPPGSCLETMKYRAGR